MARKKKDAEQQEENNEENTPTVEDYLKDLYEKISMLENRVTTLEASLYRGGMP